MKPVDIYIRVSRVGGREHLISPDEQERRGRALAKERGLTVGRVLVDLDESGGKWDRPGLQEALERVRAGASRGLIVAWLDRLSRDSEHAHRLVRELAESGGIVYAPDAPADWTSPEGELQAGIVFTFAQYVRKRSAAGFERAKERSIAAGIPVSNRAPVGYRKGVDRRLEVDQEAAPVVRELFERRAAGAGPTELGELLSVRGVRTSQGSVTWSRQAVMSVLRSRVYLGEIAYGSDRRFVNDSAHEAIVDLATWTAAQRPRVLRLRPAETYLLSGLLRCPACGYAMQGTKSGRGKRVYRCVRRHAGGLCPNPTSADARSVNEAVERLFWKYVEDVEVSGAPRTDADLAQLIEELVVAERRLEQAGAVETQDAAGDAWPGIMRERRADRDAAARALGDARALAGTEPIEATSLRREWPTLGTAERRELFASVFAVVLLRRRGRVVEIAVLEIAPDGLSRRGFKRTPGLHPIDVPEDAWEPTTHDPSEGLSDAV